MSFLPVHSDASERAKFHTALAKKVAKKTLAFEKKSFNIGDCAVSKNPKNDFRTDGVQQAPNGSEHSFPAGRTLRRPVGTGIGRHRMSYRTIDENFWRSPRVRELTDEGKLAYIFLITRGRLSGVIWQTEEELAAAIGWPIQRWRKAISELKSKNRVAIGYRYPILWIIGHIQHQWLAPDKKISPKIVSGIKRELLECPQDQIIQEVVEKYQQLLPDFPKYPIDTLSDEKPKPANEPVPEPNNENKTKTFLSENQNFSDEVVNLTNLLISKIKSNNPKTKAPSLSENGSHDAKWLKWAKDADLLLRVDLRDFKEAEQLVHWCQNHAFWKTVILSMAKFRSQYPQLRLKFKAETEWQPEAKETESERIQRLIKDK